VCKLIKMLKTLTSRQIRAISCKALTLLWLDQKLTGK
jgi:hypothetical protein